MSAQPVKARYLVALLSALMLFQAGVTTPAPVAAQEPPAAPSAAPSVPVEPTASPGPAAPLVPGAPEAFPSLAPAATAEPTAEPEATEQAPDAEPTISPARPASPPADVPPGIERVEMRSEFSETFERPDGNLVTHFYPDQIHFRPEQGGELRPIDLSLKHSADRTAVETTAAPARLSLRAADAPDGFLTLEGGGHTISFGLPEGTNAGRAGTKAEIKEDGLFVDYADFLPGGIGLRVFPHADGFKSFLVLPERPTTNQFSLAIEAPGLSLVDDGNGGFEFADREGNVVGRIPRPFMEDSSELEGRGGGLYSEAVTQSVSQTRQGWLLTLTVEESFLDGAVYPVYLDPTTTQFPTGSTTVGDSFVNSETPNTNYDTYQRSTSPFYKEMWHGNTPGTSYYNEVFIRFNSIASTLGAVKVNSATLDLYPYWQYYHSGCRNSWVERVAADWAASTIKWNNKPGTNHSYGIRCTIEGQWSGWDVQSYVQDIVNGAFTDHGLKIHANSLGQGGWKRIVSSNDGSTLKPKLVVNWDPFSATAPAHPIGGGPSAGRTLNWANDAVAVQIGYDVQVSTVSTFSSTIATSGQVTSADTSWTIPSGTSLTTGSTYYWRVRTKLGSNPSFGAWSTTASFVWSPDSNLGLAGHNTFESFDLGNGDTFSVNVATGNLVFTAPQVSLPYRGGSLDITLLHNSFDSANVGMGPGWRLSTMARLTELAGGDVVYTASDGSRHTFAKIGTTGSVTTYTRPATLYATLVKDTASAPQWTLLWRDQSVDRFTTLSTEGLLTRSEDRHGNGIDYSYYASSNRLYRATDPAGRYVEFTWDTGASPARLTSFTDWAYVMGGEIQASQTGNRRQYRLFYDAGGQLIGWANPLYSSGTCPTLNYYMTCLAWDAGRLTGISKRLSVAAISGSSIVGNVARNETATILYSGGRVSEFRDPLQTFANATGTTFRWVGAGQLRVVRQGEPPSTTTYGQLGGVTDSLARIASVWRRLGTTEIEQRTAWNATFLTEPASVTDNFGAKLNTPARTVSYTYVAGSLGLVATLTEPLTATANRVTANTYNPNNDVTQVVVSSAGSSTTTRFCYAASGCATTGTSLTMRARTDNYQGTGAKGGTDGHVENVTTEFLYSAGQLTRETRFNYAAGGSLLDSRATGYVYDSHGNLIAEIANYADGQVASSGDDIAPNSTTNARTDLTTLHTYDTAGNRISSADPRRTIELAMGTSLGADDFVTRWAYDPLSQRLRERTPTTPGVTISCASWAPDCREATWVYDGLQRVRSSRDFGNLVTASVYDRAGRTIETLEDPPDIGGSQPAVQTSSTTYDGAGRTMTSQDQRQLTNPALGYTLYVYDELGRQLSIIDAVGTAVESESASEFDALDRQVSLTVGINPLFATEHATTYEHDLGGRVVKQNDEFTCTSTTYDHRDLPVTVVEGQSTGSCSGSGLRTITNSYDGLGRLTESKVTAGQGLNDVPSQASYDGAGNTLASASILGGSTTSASFTSNPLDQLTRESRSDGSLSRTNYDPAGNPTDRCHWSSAPDEACKPVGSSFTSPPSRLSTSTYDARNRRIELIDATTNATTVYDPNHNYQLKAAYLPTGNGREQQSLYGYDERHRLISLTHQLCVISSGHNCSSTSVTGSNSYAYDVNDNRTQVVENNGSASADRRYCYDAQDRLIARRTGAACTSSPDESYEFDAAGNRTKTVVGGVTTNFAYNAAGQLCKTGATTCGTPNVTYDAAGRTRNWNGWWFSYDAEGRLNKACKDSGCATNQARVEFTYDGEGRRTEIKTAPASGSFTTLELRYQGSSVVEEWTSGTLTRSYLVDDDGAVVKLIIPTGQSGAGSYLVSWNGHGDALALHRQNADGTLTLANSFTYTSWGAPTTATHNSIPDLGFRYLYVGQFGVQWDNAFGLGLHYMQARHYAPALGRFIQPDPDGSEDNLYAYAANNPVTEIDPDGNCFIVCAIVNAVVDTAIYLATTDSKDWSAQGIATAAVTGAVTGFLGVGLLSKVTKIGSVVRALNSGSNAVKATTRAVSASRYIGRGGSGYSPLRLAKSAATSCGRSFSPDTLVLLADGTQVEISALAVSDMVLAAHEVTGVIGAYPVTAVWLNDDPVSGWLVIDGELIVTTPDHPFFVLGRGWTEAGDLVIGDLIPSADGSAGAVQAMSWTRGPDLLYDLTVSEAHTFFVGEGAWLVHNCTRAQLREVINAWDKGTFGSRAQSIRYHMRYHGKGRSVLDYTRDAQRFANQHRPLFKFKPGSKPQLQPSWFHRSGKQAGHYTSSGKIITYWD